MAELGLESSWACSLSSQASSDGEGSGGAGGRGDAAVLLLPDGNWAAAGEWVHVKPYKLARNGSKPSWELSYDRFATVSYTPRRCQAAATPLPRRCHAAATPLPRRCHAAATPLPRRCHAAATPLPRR